MKDKNLPEINYTSATVLIAGAANFVGYHLAESLLISDIAVIGIDSLITGSEDIITKLYKYPRFSFFKANINQPLPAALYKEDISHIVHLANIEACAERGILQLNELLTNSFGVKNLLDLSLDKKSAFIFASTINIYQGLASTTSLTHYFNGGDLEDRLTYAEAKRYAENLCHEYAQLYNTDIRIARLSEIYGPHMSLNRGTPFAQLLAQFLAGQNLTVYGDGSDHLYLTYISDTIYGLVKLIFAPPEVVSQGIFYFVQPQQVTLLETAHALAHIDTPPRQIDHESAPKISAALKPPQIDLSRSKKDLYWEAKITLEDGFKRTCDYFNALPSIVPPAEPQEKPSGEETPVSPSTGSPTQKERNFSQYRATLQKTTERLVQPELETTPPQPSLPQPSLGTRLKEVLKTPRPPHKTDPTTETHGWLDLKKQEQGKATTAPHDSRQNSATLSPAQKTVPATSTQKHTPEEAAEMGYLESLKRPSLWQRWRKSIFVFLTIVCFFLAPIARPLYLSFNSWQTAKSAWAALKIGDTQTASVELLKLQESTAALKTNLDSLRWLTYFLGQKERYQVTQQLLSASSFAIEGVYLSVEALQSAEELLSTVQSASPPLGGEEDKEIKETVEILINNIILNFDSATQRFTLAETEIDGTDLSIFPESLKHMAEEGKSFLTNLNQNLPNAQVLLKQTPILLGLDEPHTFLILLQNNSELRATGGFIGSYAVADMVRGKLTRLKVDDIYNPDGLLENTEPAPQPLQDNLGVDELGIRDANWWPDFATSASKIISLYEQATKEKVKSVIGINLSTLQNLLAQMGPVSIPDYQERISADNLFERAEFHSEVGFTPGSDQKKRFLTALTQEILANLLSASTDTNLGLNKSAWQAVVTTFGEGLSGNDIYLFSSSSELADAYSQLGWNGNLKPLPVEKDFIAVVDSNIGGNKANFWVNRKTNYRLDIDREGNLSGVLTVKWTHTGTSGTWPGGDYKNFVRIYVPKYAKLQEAEGFVSQLEPYTEFEYKVFSGIVEVPVNSSHQITLKYNLPPEVGFKDKNTYELTVRRQAGLVGESFVLTADLPAFLPAQTLSSGEIDNNLNKILWETILNTNKSTALLVADQKVK
ncbi:DUF4012 domain-containing protein [Patescibacteria group bacterium]|nr:DUF4012 domain-containing protein [Patescibacteria group bacterium]